MARRPDHDLHRVATRNTDGLGMDVHVDPLPVHLILQRVIGIDSLYVKVHDIRPEVGESPGNPIIVANDHTRHARKGEPSDIERALIRLGRTVQRHLIPDRRHPDTQMGVVCQDRGASAASLWTNDPAVRTDTDTATPSGSIKPRQILEGVSNRLQGIHRCWIQPHSTHPRRRITNDDRVLFGVRRIEQRHFFSREIIQQQGAGDLVIHVATQVPGHHLPPQNRINDSPLLGGIAVVDQLENRILKTKLNRRLRDEIGVHTSHIAIQGGTALRSRLSVLILRQLGPTHCSQECISLELILAKHFG